MQNGCHKISPYFVILKLAHSCFFICCLKMFFFFPVSSLSLFREVVFLELRNDLRSVNIKLGKQTI